MACEHKVYEQDVAAQADGICPLCQQAEAARLRKALTDFLAAWDLLPAKQNYTPSQIQAWLSSDRFAKAIPQARAALGTSHPNHSARTAGAD